MAKGGVDGAVLHPGDVAYHNVVVGGREENVAADGDHKGLCTDALQCLLDALSATTLLKALC